MKGSNFNLKRVGQTDLPKGMNLPLAKPCKIGVFKNSMGVGSADHISPENDGRLETLNSVQ